MANASPSCFSLLRHVVCRAFSRAWAKTGNRIAARMAMTAITTSSSMSVKPLRKRNLISISPGDRTREAVQAAALAGGLLARDGELPGHAPVVVQNRSVLRDVRQDSHVAARASADGPCTSIQRALYQDRRRAQAGLLRSIAKLKTTDIGDVECG